MTKSTKVNKDVSEKEKLLLEKIADAFSEVGIADKGELCKATVLKFEFTSTNDSTGTDLKKDCRVAELEKEIQRLKRENEKLKREISKKKKD